MSGPSSSDPEIPAIAAWRHVDARVGFEVLFLRREGDRYHLDGHSTAVQEGEAWGIRYALELDTDWATRRRAHCRAIGHGDERSSSRGRGMWRVDCRPASQLDGCLDVDLEASAATNSLPVRRLGLRIGEGADAPAVYVRAPILRVERLEQSYARIPNDGDQRARFDYVVPAFDFKAVLVYDRFGFILDYPGIAVRVA